MTPHLDPPARYAGCCVACMTPTDTGLAFIGDAEFASAGLTALGVPPEQVQATLAAAIGHVDGSLPTGDLPVVVRACASCSARSDLEVGPWPNVPQYIRKGTRS